MAMVLPITVASQPAILRTPGRPIPGSQKLQNERVASSGQQNGPSPPSQVPGDPLGAIPVAGARRSGKLGKQPG